MASYDEPFIDTVEFYNDLKQVLAERLSKHADEPLSVRHWNSAARALWPLCTAEVQSELVLR